MAGPIRISILANGRQARAEAAATARSYGVMGKSVSKVGKLLAGAFAVTALARGAIAVGKVGAAYVDSLNKIQALTGSTDTQMSRLSSTLESQAGAFAKYGQTTGDAAQGMVELTKSGLSANKALGAIRGTMLLAKAGELEVADASELVANTLNTFGLKAKAAGRIANSLANAANISSSDVSDLAESFKYVAPLSAKAGVSIDQTNAILAELANSGIKASQAGTSLRTFLLNLQAPSAAGANALKDLNVQVYDAQGNMRPLPALIGDLNRGLGDLSQAQQNAKLKDIFGKIGITGAQVILKNGTAGLRDYTEGVKRAGAAEKLAASASKGLAGTVASVRAQVISTTQELYRRYSPAIDDALRGALDFASQHKNDVVPALQAIGDVITDHVAPALESVTGLAADTAAAFGSGNGGLAQAVGQGLLDALSTLADLTKTAADSLDRLPGPVKSVAVEVAIAALVFPRLASGVASATAAMKNAAIYTRVLAAEMADAETRGRNFTSVLARIRSAAGTAAGVGGMVALTQGAQQSNTALQALANIGGGALLGFSVAGPIGAAVGGTAGALLTLAQHAGKAGDAAQLQIPKFDGLKESLDGVTAAATQATKQTIVQNLAANGSLQTLNQYGISSRTAVNAILGEAGARAKVTAAIQSEKAMRNAALAQATKLQREYDSVVGSGTAEENRRQELAKLIQGWKDEATAHDQVIKSIQKAIGTYRAETREKRAEIAATKDYKGLLKGLPKAVKTKVHADGIEPTKKAVIDLARRYKLTPKQIKTVLKAAGFEGTKKQVDDVRKKLEDLKRTKPDLKPALRSVQQFSLQAKRQAIEGANGVSDNLKKGTSKAKANLNPFVNSVRSGTKPAEGIATSGGNQVGFNLKAGVISGFSGTQAALVAAAVAAVRAAVAAAKNAGKIKSPSRVMRDEVGAMLGKGLVIGLADQAPAAARAADKLVRGVLRGVVKGSDGIRSALSSISSFISKTQDRAWSETEKRIKGHFDQLEKAARKHFDGKALKRELASLHRQEHEAMQRAKRDWKEQGRAAKAMAKEARAALTFNGRLQDVVTRKLDAAVQKLSELRQQAAEFAASIKAGFVSFGSIVGLGQQEDGTVSLDALLSQLRQRAQQAAAFTRIIRQLKDKLNQTSLQQLLDQAASGDIAGALATAQAVASGGQAAIDEINQLTATFASLGGSLGDQMAGEFYDAGIKAAEGVVAGLKAMQAELDKIARRIARVLLQALKDELGIKSPSREFRKIAEQSVAGLTVGFKANDGYVRRIGTTTAAALKAGFGTPQLDAYMSTATGSPQQSEAAALRAEVAALRAELATGLQTVATAAGTTGPARAGQAFADRLKDRAGNRSRRG